MVARGNLDIFGPLRPRALSRLAANNQRKFAVRWFSPLLTLEVKTEYGLRLYYDELYRNARVHWPAFHSVCSAVAKSPMTTAIAKALPRHTASCPQPHRAPPRVPAAARPPRH